MSRLFFSHVISQKCSFRNPLIQMLFQCFLIIFFRVGVYWPFSFLSIQEKEDFAVHNGEYTEFWGDQLNRTPIFPNRWLLAARAIRKCCTIWNFRGRSFLMLRYRYSQRSEQYLRRRPESATSQYAHCFIPRIPNVAISRAFFVSAELLDYRLH